MRKLNRGARFKGKGVTVWGEDDMYYYVLWGGKEIDGIIGSEVVGRFEYRGKVPKDSPDLVFKDED